MKTRLGGLLINIPALLALSGAMTIAASEPIEHVHWLTVVDSSDVIPGDPPGRTFNSYNQPSTNQNGLVVFRARSRGGMGLAPTHGIYTRDMGSTNSPVRRLLDRTTMVPPPNNRGSTFRETPSFPRIDFSSDTVVTRGNHQPVWRYTLPDGSETQAGTSGIYTNPYGILVSGVTRLGVIDDFSFWAVPGTVPPLAFDVFPGAPAVTDKATLVFKGNFTVNGQGQTGVFYRDLVNEPVMLSNGVLLSPAAGQTPVVVIADTNTVIPGTGLLFGSTAAPSAVDRRAVFAGFDNEENPTAGGIYLASLDGPRPALDTLVGIGSRVPGESVNDTFTRLSEGVSFDGRYVGFWGAWGTIYNSDVTTGEATCISGCTERVLHCPTDGYADRIDHCLQQCPEPAGCLVREPDGQGLFVHDTLTGRTRTVVKNEKEFDRFLFWNFSGQVPGGESDGNSADDGELARWRASSFIATSANGSNTFRSVFKAVRDDLVGLYTARGPGQAIRVLLDTSMSGALLNENALPGSRITEIGIEREGLRDQWLAINASIDGGPDESDGTAGIYAARLR